METCRSEDVGSEDHMTEAVALVDDLFFASKLYETAKRAGVTLEIVLTGEALIAKAAENPAAMVIVDLNAHDGPLEALERISHAKIAGKPRRIIAFLSHVQTELAERARAAGCQEVMPRSRFSQNLVAILRDAKPDGQTAPGNS
jgi:DNA-binding NarL/FixJ family response regulator